MATQLIYDTGQKKERKTVIVDRALAEIYERDGVVTVDSVLAEARDKKSPLHPFFEWNDKAAAEKYRTVQCYSLIMGSKFVVQLVENGRTSTRQIKGSANVRKLVSAFRGEGFTLRTDALKDNEKRHAIVETKRSQLRSWTNSVIDIPELTELRLSILTLLAEPVEEGEESPE